MVPESKITSITTIIVLTNYYHDYDYYYYDCYCYHYYYYSRTNTIIIPIPITVTIGSLELRPARPSSPTRATVSPQLGETPISL